MVAHILFWLGVLGILFHMVTVVINLDAKDKPLTYIGAYEVVLTPSLFLGAMAAKYLGW